MTLQKITDDLNKLIQKRLEEGNPNTLLGHPHFLLSRFQTLLCTSAEAVKARKKYGIGIYCYLKTEGSPTFEVYASTTEANPYHILSSRENHLTCKVFTIKRKKCKNIGNTGVYGLVPDRAILNSAFAPEISVDEFYHLLAQSIARNNQPLLQAIQCIDGLAKELGQDKLHELNRAFRYVEESTQLNAMLPMGTKRTGDVIWSQSIFNPELRAKLLTLLNEEEAK